MPVAATFRRISSGLGSGTGTSSIRSGSLYPYILAARIFMSSPSFSSVTRPRLTSSVISYSESSVLIQTEPVRCSDQRFDQLGGNRMVGPRILSSDELAIDNHIGGEIDRPGGHLAACSLERIRHVEIHLCVKDVVLDPFLFRCRKNCHLVAGIWPSLGPFFGLVLITGDERCAKLSRVWHCRDERNRTVAEQCRGLRELMEVTEDLARVRVLHQVYDRRLATGHEHACVAVQPFLNHRTQRVDLG